MKKEKLTFFPSDHKTTDELLQQIEERNQKMLDNIDDIRKGWFEFKTEFNNIQKKYKKKDTKVYTYCFAGIYACIVLLLLLEWWGK